MECFSFKDNMDYEFVSLVLDILEQYKVFFIKHNGYDKFDEAQHQTLMHCMRLYTGDRTDVRRIKNYILSLGETILKNRKEDKHEVLDDFNSNQDTCEDIIDDVVEGIYGVSMYNEHLKKVIELAFVFPEDFIKFCKAVISGGEKMKFSQNFKDVCLSASKSDKSFSKHCMEVYEMYSSILYKYLEITPQEGWSEADFPYIARTSSKRVQLQDSNGNPVMKYHANRVKIPTSLVDADKETLRLTGRTVDNYAVYRVGYRDFIDAVEYLMFSEEPLNMIKCELEGVVVLRTPAGSMSVINPMFGDVLKLCKYEVLTNVLQSMSGKFIAEGSSNFYVFAEKKDYVLPTVDIGGTKIALEAVLADDIVF